MKRRGREADEAQRQTINPHPLLPFLAQPFSALFCFPLSPYPILLWCLVLPYFATVPSFPCPTLLCLPLPPSLPVTVVMAVVIPTPGVPCLSTHTLSPFLFAPCHSVPCSAPCLFHLAQPRSALLQPPSLVNKFFGYNSSGYINFLPSSGLSHPALPSLPSWWLGYVVIVVMKVVVVVVVHVTALPYPASLPGGGGDWVRRGGSAAEFVHHLNSR